MLTTLRLSDANSVTSEGKSEYRLNNKVVAAAAYNDQLKKFNILVKAKNFLVPQGDVEKVASQNPQALSRLVDQISGSLELKEQYEAAKVVQEKALENQKYSAFKRKGMSTELSFFKGQKNEAERFKKLQEERDAHVLQHVLWKLFHLTKKIDGDVKEVQKKKDKSPDLRRALETAERQVKAKRVAQGKAATAKIDQQRAYREKEREIQKQNLPLLSVDAKIRHDEKGLNRAEQACRDIEPEVARYEASIAKLERDLIAARQAADRAAQEQAAASGAEGVALSEADLNEYHELKAAANLQAIEERQKLEVLSRDIKTKTRKLQSLQDRMAEATKQREKQQAEANVLSEREKILKEKAQKAQDSLASIRAAQQEAEEKQKSIREREEKLNVTLKDCLTKLNEAGMYQGEQTKEIKKKEQVSRLQKSLSGVHGRFVDLCRPTQNKYSTAISIILGKNADAIIVDTQKIAMDCIQELKRIGGGQATFIPLDTAQVKDVNDRLRSISTGARLAFDIIQYDAKLERAMQYACGNALVCDTLAIARNICYDKKQDVKAVSLDGTVIHKSGLISGGTSDETRTRRWEDQEIEGLKRQRDQCINELKALGQGRQAVIKKAQDTSRVNSVETEYNAIRDDLNAVSQRLSGLRNEISSLDTQIAQLSPRIVSARQDLDGSTRQTTVLQTTVNRADDDVFASFCQRIGVRGIRQYEQRQLALMQEQVDARQQYEQQIKRLEHSIEFEKAQLGQQQARLQANRESTEKRTSAIAELKREKSTLQEAVKALVDESEEMKEALEEMQESETTAVEALKVVRAQAEKAQANVDAHAKEIASLELELDTLGTERIQVLRKCRLEEIELPLQSRSANLNVIPLQTQVQDDDDEDSPMTDGSPEDSMNLDNAEERVTDLGIKIDFSGLSKTEKQDGSEELEQVYQSRIKEAIAELDQMTPNVKATERLAEQEGKMKVIDSDFEKARKEASAAQNRFAELKRERCRLFNKAFELVRVKVEKVYGELTRSKLNPSGGKAYLVMENTDEPYLGGVQYSAIPPGKTYMNIENLSGGEKTMAAIALLLAMQSVYPAPFIVLDEVDAALDKVNIQSVANYIRSRASDQLQFIVISHKVPLYERSSALVGVMRKHEFNSSATLTLDLEQYA